MVGDEPEIDLSFAKNSSRRYRVELPGVPWRSPVPGPDSPRRAPELIQSAFNLVWLGTCWHPVLASFSFDFGTSNRSYHYKSTKHLFSTQDDAERSSAWLLTTLRNSSMPEEIKAISRTTR